MTREEYNLPLNEKSYNHLLTKADGNIITKHDIIFQFTMALPLNLTFSKVSLQI
ncbi:MAG: hypothetical protein ACLUR5_00530 [Eubacterium ventriosum]